MKVHTVSLINAIILIVMSVWAYFASENPSMTALIPAVFGLILLALNNGLKKENKVISHIAVVLTLLIIVALVAKPLISAIDDGRQIAIFRIVIMILSSLIAMVYFVKSFIKARSKA